MPTSTLHSWKRLLRQTIALTHKNLLIFYKSPLITLLRALIFPIVVTVVLCVLRTILLDSNSATTASGIAHSARRVNTLTNSLDANPGARLIFVRNGVNKSDVDPIINGVIAQIGPDTNRHLILDDPDDLFLECPQSLQGDSSCFAAVIFTSSNVTSVAYVIAIGENDAYRNWNLDTHQTVAADRLMPIQWAIDSQIGNFTNTALPVEQPWIAGTVIFGPVQEQFEPVSQWITRIATFVSPLFLLAMMGVVYHLSMFVATERESGMSELLAAQSCSTTPRILSNLISFTILYLPGWIVCSVLITKLLFLHCSDILLLVLSILAAGALTTATHLVGSFFQKAQLAGLYTSILMLCLGFVVIAFNLANHPNFNAIQALSVIFPPFTYANLIADIARAEIGSRAFSLTKPPVQFVTIHYPSFDGYLYIVFFMVQIILFTAGTFAVEKYMWGVTRKFETLPAESDVTLRVVGLSKTYDSVRHWYWPFRAQPARLAVENLNLELKRGSVNFLLGPNGGGKTTTLKAVTGMISMDPQSRLEINEEAMAFGVCPQGNVFWPNLTVNDHIKIWRKIKTAGGNQTVPSDEEDVLVECDLIEKQNASVKTLSGGQMRKMQLAIAFVGGSKMCCIDEASSGLDPLSRRNIWNIIASGHSRRTVLVTTHFLDEADVLADHIAIIYKGRLVCEGSATSLKSAYGDSYTIREISNDNDEEIVVYKAPNSSSATKKVLELEEISDASYSVEFPTLDQVFLKVTDSTSRFHEQGDFVTEEDDSPTELYEFKKMAFNTTEIAQDEADLEASNAIGFARQIYVILRKRYLLLRVNWISFCIALAVPIVIAGALRSVILDNFGAFASCAGNLDTLRNLTRIDVETRPDTYKTGVPLSPVSGPFIPSLGYNPQAVAAILGPASQFEGPVQDDLYLFSVQRLFQYPSPAFNSTAEQALAGRKFVGTLDETLASIGGSGSRAAFGLFAPQPDNVTIQYSANGILGQYAMSGMSMVTDRIANSTAISPARKVDATVRLLRKVQKDPNFRNLPFVIFIALGFLCSTAAAIVYPTFERINNSRALQYCNGVSPAALWIAYLIFEMQIMIVTSLLTWGLLFTGPAAYIWFAPSYLLGAFLLFGIATYLGVFVLSMFIKSVAFAVAAGSHLILLGIYVAAYVLNQSYGLDQNEISWKLQAGLGLTSPAANLARALFISIDAFDVTCGRSGFEVQPPFSYKLYGGVYVNFIIQIVFLIIVLALIEYGNLEWLRKIIWRKRIPARLQYVVEDGDPVRIAEDNKTVDSSPLVPALLVSRVTKYFGKLFSNENISFNIAPNETLALLGANGAGKTTMINMIRGLIKPNFGDIYLDGLSVLDEPRKARMQLGVCPQDDAVDELTVRQTLNFYGSMKGLKDVRRSVDGLLNAFNIVQFADMSVKKLSGGTRRKLMVSIALLGNPKVLLLDEPSTGLDAGAKRTLWHILEPFRRNRAILLTTHSMEETEALADKIAIIGTRMLATGTLNELRKVHGGAYRIRATYSADVAESDIARILQSSFAENEISNLGIRYGEVNFEVPHQSRQLGHIMQTMESMMMIVNYAAADDDAVSASSRKEPAEGGAAVASERDMKRVLRHYTISEPTMEEVFMNVCRKTGTTPL